jgi:hypothetical protein
MELEEEDSSKLFEAFSKVILLLCKDKYNSRDYKTNLEMLRLSSEKKETLHTVRTIIWGNS